MLHGNYIVPFLFARVYLHNMVIAVHDNCKYDRQGEDLDNPKQRQVSSDTKERKR